MVSLVRRAVALSLTFASVVLASSVSARADDSLADVDAAARSAGNRPEIARKIGDAIFAATWPAQVMKVRVDAVGSHAVAGLVLSGVKFHRSLDRAGFLDEIAGLAATTFAHSDVEEVDVWATVPVPTHKHEVVAGDLAMPTSHIVFAVTAKRADGRAFLTRLRSGRDVYWDPGWSTTLASR